MARVMLPVLLAAIPFLPLFAAQIVLDIAGAKETPATALVRLADALKPLFTTLGECA